MVFGVPKSFFKIPDKNTTFFYTNVLLKSKTSKTLDLPVPIANPTDLGKTGPLFESKIGRNGHLCVFILLGVKLVPQTAWV